MKRFIKIFIGFGTILAILTLGLNCVQTTESGNDIGIASVSTLKNASTIDLRITDDNLNILNTFPVRVITLFQIQLMPIKNSSIVMVRTLESSFRIILLQRRTITLS